MEFAKNEKTEDFIDQGFDIFTDPDIDITKLGLGDLVRTLIDQNPRLSELYNACKNQLASEPGQPVSRNDAINLMINKVRSATGDLELNNQLSKVLLEATNIEQIYFDNFEFNPSIVFNIAMLDQKLTQDNRLSKYYVEAIKKSGPFEGLGTQEKAVNIYNTMHHLIDEDTTNEHGLYKSLMVDLMKVLFSCDSL
jgi:hypothetical protein